MAPPILQRSILSALLCLASIGTAQSQTPSEAAVRRAISTFCDAPLSTKGRAAPKTILEFGEASDAVLITISPGYVPWTRADKKYENSELLLAAYVAGNVLGQLDSGVKGNDAYSGMIQVFRVYRHLKAKDASFKVPEIEDYLEMHRKGELAVHFAKVAKESKHEE